jgi:hypothetical protein
VGAKDGGQRGESEESEKGERSKGRWAKERPKGNPMDRSEASEVYRYERSVCDIPESEALKVDFCSSPPILNSLSWTTVLQKIPTRDEFAELAVKK